MNERTKNVKSSIKNYSVALPKCDEFVKGSSALIAYPSGAKQADEANKPRRAIGFGREGEMISESKANIMLRETGYRRAIGFGREGERIKNEPIKAKHAVGFGRENEPPVKTGEAKHAVGFGRQGEKPVALPKAKEAQKPKQAIGYGREGEKPVKPSKGKKGKIGFDINKLKDGGR